METESKHCPECGTSWADGTTCEDNFHQLLFWEAERPSLGVVHHLTVLCYHMQHPSLYSQDGLENAKGLLVSFVVKGLSTETVRKQNGAVVASDKRGWTVTARPDSKGAYAHPVTWTMTARDVVAGGMDNYVENTTRWAGSVLASLQASNNIVTTI